MCGRYSFAVIAEMIEEYFHVKVDTNTYKPKYNCAPSQNLAVISIENPGELSFFRWGFIPKWVKNPSASDKLINAKAETIDVKPAFKNSFQYNRCLVLSDGFYEWKKTGKEKIPYRITMRGGLPFAMAGIYDSRVTPGGEVTNSFAIITTKPNKLVKNIHSRMPAILPPGKERLWLDEYDPVKLKSLLKPIDAQLLTAYRVSTLVNSPANESPEIIEAVADNPRSGLFPDL